MMHDSLYHSSLRVASLTCALVLLFESGIVSPITKELSDNARQYVATAIGVNAAVKPTELNAITAELTEQRQALEQREAEIREREIAVSLNEGGAASSQTSTWILSAILFILLLLIILNYVLDFIRNQAPNNRKQPA